MATVSDTGISRLLRGSGETGNMAVTRAFGPAPVAGARLSIDASWTGTPTGVFSLECTFDGQTWRTVPGADPEFTASPNAQPAGADGASVWNWCHVPGSMIRVRYTVTSGTGTVWLRAVWGD